MKRFVYILGMSVFFAAASFGQRKLMVFELTGDIATLKKSYIVHSYRSFGKDIRDTAKVTNGKFRFTGRVDGWSYSTLMTDSLKFFHEQYIENTRMHISQKDSASEVVFTGSPSEKESYAYQKIAQPLVNSYSHLYWEYMDLKVKDSVAGGRMKREVVDPALNKYLSAVKAHINSHPNSPVSLDQLRYVHRLLEVDDLKTLFNKLSKKLQNAEGAAGLRIEIVSRSTQYIGRPAIGFTQKDMNGNAVSLSSYKGKYVLLDFWASWCGPCRGENPNMLKAYNAYKDKGLEILAVSTDNDEDKWRKAVKEDQLPWTQVRNRKGDKNDVAAQYHIYQIPSNFLIDPNGIIMAKDLRGEALHQKLAEIFPN